MIISGYALKLPKDISAVNNDVDGNKEIMSEDLVNVRSRIVPCVAEVSLVEDSILFYIRSLHNLNFVPNVPYNYNFHSAKTHPLMYTITTTSSTFLQNLSTFLCEEHDAANYKDDDKQPRQHCFWCVVPVSNLAS